MFSDYRKALTALGVTLVVVLAIDYRLDPARARTLAAMADRSAAAAATAAARASPGAQAVASELRVCADPNNLPFSNAREQGFENALARLIAVDLGRTLRYVWWPERRGFLRNTLDTHACDVVMGAPAGDAQMLTTRPYYRSTYVFVTRRDRQLRLRSYDDPRLRALRIGVHTNVPPTQVLAVRELQNNIRGYSIYGNYLEPDPPRALIDAVARGDVDVAIAWGPLAGYFAPREPVPLELMPAPTPSDLAYLPMSFAICMGVRHEDATLRTLLDAEIVRRRQQIDALLRRFDVPLVATDGQVWIAQTLQGEAR